MKDIEIKWEENVKEARRYIVDRKNNQMVVARLATEVCEISWGGSAYSGKYTLARFAGETGMKPKQLSQWVGVYKKVYVKLNNKEKESASYTQLAHTACRVSNDAQKSFVNQVFKDVTSNNLDNRIKSYIKELRSIAHNFEQKKAAEFISMEAMEEIVFYCGIITRNIRKVHPKIKEVNHDIARTTDVRTVTAAAALGIERNSSGIKVRDPQGHIIVLTPKDRTVISHMKSHNEKWFTPTELGMKLKGLNSNSASAWACRTLNKLVSLDYVQRNKVGHYKWK